MTLNLDALCAERDDCYRSIAGPPPCPATEDLLREHIDLLNVLIELAQAGVVDVVAEVQRLRETERLAIAACNTRASLRAFLLSDEGYGEPSGIAGFDRRTVEGLSWNMSVTKTMDALAAHVVVAEPFWTVAK